MSIRLNVRWVVLRLLQISLFCLFSQELIAADYQFEVNFAKAEIAFHKKEFKKSEKILRSLIKRDIAEVQALGLLVQVLTQKGERGKAIKLVKKQINLVKEKKFSGKKEVLSELWLELSNIYIGIIEVPKKNGRDKVVRLAKKALRNAAKNKKARNIVGLYRARLYMVLGKYHLALKYLSSLLAREEVERSSMRDIVKFYMASCYLSIDRGDLGINLLNEVKDSLDLGRSHMFSKNHILSRLGLGVEYSSNVTGLSDSSSVKDRDGSSSKINTTTSFQTNRYNELSYNFLLDALYSKQFDDKYQGLNYLSFSGVVGANFFPKGGNNKFSLNYVLAPVLLNFQSNSDSSYSYKLYTLTHLFSPSYKVLGNRHIVTLTTPIFFTNYEHGGSNDYKQFAFTVTYAPILKSFWLSPEVNLKIGKESYKVESADRTIYSIALKNRIFLQDHYIDFSTKYRHASLQSASESLLELGGSYNFPLSFISKRVIMDLFLGYSKKSFENGNVTQTISSCQIDYIF